ncbi:MAG: BMP family ABC transporter substrate-binding protein [Anaerorhabdus sp.]
MKKLKRFMVVLLIAAITLSGCSNNSESTSTEGESDDDLKVMAIINGTLGDKSFFDSLKVGMDELGSREGIKTNVVETGFDETKWEPALIDASEGDWDIIIAGTWQMSDYVSKIAEQYPDKKYIVYDSAVDFSDGQNSNVYAIEYKQNEGSFLAGAVSANLSESGILGFVGGLDVPVINDFMVGFADGAQYVNDQIKIATSYVGNFSDTGKAKELGFAQIGLGADVIFPAASVAGNGALEAAKEKNVFTIGVDSDQALLYKEANDDDMANLIATSVLKEVGNSIIRAIELEQKGELVWGQGEVLGIKEGAIGIAKNDIYQQVVPVEVQELVTSLEEKIKNGEIVVDTAFGLSAEELSELRNTLMP